jgi:hypothetical protein
MCPLGATSAPPVSVDRRHARRARLRMKGPSSQRPSLEPSKITVKSASCSRVLQMALRATGLFPLAH